MMSDSKSKKRFISNDINRYISKHCDPLTRGAIEFYEFELGKDKELVTWEQREGFRIYHFKGGTAFYAWHDEMGNAGGDSRRYSLEMESIPIDPDEFDEHDGVRMINNPSTQGTEEAF